LKKVVLVFLSCSTISKNDKIVNTVHVSIALFVTTRLHADIFEMNLFDTVRLPVSLLSPLHNLR